jgi:hypothetical protein
MGLTGRIFACAISAIIIGAAATAWAQAKLDPDSFKLWGGTYSTECGNANAPRLRVASDALMVEQGNKRLTGRNVQASYSFYGQSPPPDYQVALTGEVRGNLQLLFIVFQDKTGVYITLDGDREVQAALGKPLLGRKYRSCDTTRRSPSAAVVPTPVPTPRGEAVTNPWDLLSDRKFKSAYYKALGPKVKQDWLATLDGPAAPTSKINVAGNEYVFASSCKNHDCTDNNVVLLYSPTQGTVYGKVFDQRRATLIGNPSAAVASELDRLWVATYRQNR